MDLQKAPQGLLGAFDLKTLGHSPTAFSAEVRPTVEVLDFYVRPELRFMAQSATIPQGGTGATSTIRVPGGGTSGYLVYGCSVSTVLDFADNAYQSAGYIHLVGQVSGTVTLATGTFIPGVNFPTTGTTRITHFWFPRPFLLAPGEAIVGTGGLQVATTQPASVILTLMAANLP